MPVNRWKIRKKFLFEELTGLLFPENIYCLSCGDTMESSRFYGICDCCAEKINWNRDNPFLRSMDQFAFSDLWACFHYGFYPRRIIAGFKLGARPYAARPLGRLLADRLALTDAVSRGDADLLLAAVPMHSEKEKKRGFNQAELLAFFAAKETGLPYEKGLLRKEVATRSMRLSDAVARRSMQQDAFSVSPANAAKMQGKHIILVDDVVTTGSTADACSRVLLQNGAAKVSVLCLAVGSRAYMQDAEETES